MKSSGGGLQQMMRKVASHNKERGSGAGRQEARSTLYEMAKEHYSCPVLKPSKAEFSMPFCDYIRRILRRHPDVGMFRVIPPSDWSPRKAPFPKLEDLVISCPIKQHVFPEQAAKGAYRCVLVEQKAMSVEEFRKLADSSDHQPPPKGRGPKTAQDDDDAGGEDLMERRFWSSLTVNPSVYGADNEQSCFDEKLKYGWNMRSLGDLLKTVPDIPDIPGVTTPMTYYGMWKAFFSWHTEDADLYSINYLHFGAPKMWYCIAPQQRAAFEGLAQNLFPQLYRKCKGFLRHKDIMISPTTLRTHGIPFSQCKQEPGEFVVLNAAAFHSGFNMGFNCAEAVNFAMEDWIPIGKAAQACTCSALQDAVRINMRLFCDDSDLDSNSSSSMASRSSESCRSTCGDGEAAESDGEDEAASETSSSGSGGGLPPLHAAGQVRKRRADGAPGGPAGKRARPDGGGTGRWRRQQHLLPGPARMKLRGMLKAKAMSLRTLREAAMKLLPSPAERGEPAYRPCAVVGEDDHGKRFWHLVRELPEEPVKGRGSVMVQELKEGSDGLWRLSRSKWPESRQALIRVRSQWMGAGVAGGSAGGFRLNTLRSRILSTDLEP